MSNLDSRAANILEREIHRFYWGIWSELGVSGWGRTHEQWAIDPESLIVFSASVIDKEPRLRDEVLDWCIRNWRHVSGVRLRHLLNENEDEETEAWGRFAATVNRFSGSSKWPRATVQFRYSVTGRSSLRSLSERSMVYLRMRSIFGLSARTEVLRYLLFTRERSTAAMLATQTNYTKRNVADACESLVQAGVLQSRQTGNRLYFSLADGEVLLDFLGLSPPIHPDWPALLRVVNALFRWTESVETDERVLVVRTHGTFSEIAEDLDSLRMERPEHLTGSDFMPIWREWSTRLMKSLADGEWPIDTGTRVSPALSRKSAPSRNKAS
jgi:hypothetical protein